jgi:ubiquinone/menaquinone biosynthesis C-methylase UbiE
VVDHVARNRTFWDADADAYQAAHGDDLAARPLAWGAWRRPEDELHVLGDLRGRDVLELGCGGAQWSVALARSGVPVTGVDISRAQLAHARDNAHAAAVRVPFVVGNAERLPFRDGAFDVVFCDHGAMSFCDPTRSLPEVARVLRAGGLLAFSATHPLVYLTWDDEKHRQTRKLHLDHAELGCLDFGDGTVDWVVPIGRWIDLLHEAGFEIDQLLELVAPPDATTTYADFVPTRWAQRWPAEVIWRARRR